MGTQDGDGQLFQDWDTARELQQFSVAGGATFRGADTSGVASIKQCPRTYNINNDTNLCRYTKMVLSMQIQYITFW